MIMDNYLKETFYIDSRSEAVASETEKILSGASSDAMVRAVKLYYAVRDSIRYNPYRMSLNPEEYRASFVLKQGEGFCIQKAILLTSFARAAGIPCRLGFANVVNHLSTRRLREILKTDLFVFHGYNELYLHGKWVKATPAFDRDLCEKFGILPLEFNGHEDSIFHPLDKAGRKHMEYVHDYGTFDDFPLDVMIEEMRRHYPHLMDYFSKTVPVENGDFHGEALIEKDL